MFKVLFAEDELLVRLGLQNAIPWHEFQMELSALAENGLEAFRLFESIRPDVLITDLRMDGMDGMELVKRVRQIDPDCAILVLSCVNDFETLRKLIPYHINAYVVKVSISMDEVCEALYQVQEYLIRIGRKAEDGGKSVGRTQKELGRFLMGELIGCTFEGTDRMGYVVLFRLKEEEACKINELAMNFVYELVERQFPGHAPVPLQEKDFLLFFEKEEYNMKERIKRIHHSVEGFLGVRFIITYCNRKENEELKDWFDRAYIQQFQLSYEDNSGKALIQKALSYIQEHYRESLGLKEVSRVIGLSGSYFSYLFKQQTGKNYVEYLNEIRLEKAMEDLMQSDEKLVVIAQKHGFQNLEYFSRYFKKKTGESPARWRKRINEKTGLETEGTDIYIE